MPSGRRIIYWDACVFLSYIEDVSDRMTVLEALLSSSGRTGDHQIVTSELSRAEVAFAAVERTHRALDPTVEAAIDALWADKRAIKTVDVHQLITADARDLMRQAIPPGWALKPGDAIHLATARLMQAVEFHTYDDKLFKYSPMVGYPIHLPQVVQPMLPLPRNES